MWSVVSSLEQTAMEAVEDAAVGCVEMAGRTVISNTRQDEEQQKQLLLILIRCLQGESAALTLFGQTRYFN